MNQKVLFLGVERACRSPRFWSVHMWRFSILLTFTLLPHWLFLLIPHISSDKQCPSLQVDEWRFPQVDRHNITGKKQDKKKHKTHKVGHVNKTTTRTVSRTSVYSWADFVPPADRFQPGESFLPAQEHRCQKDPQPAGTLHPPLRQGSPPAPHRVSTDCSELLN